MQPESSLPRLDSPEGILWQMIDGKISSQVVYALARLRIADALGDGGKDARELAELVGCDPDSLERFLRVAVGLHLLERDPSGAYAPTPLTECLRNDHPSRLSAWAIHHGNEWNWRPWGELAHAIQTGASGSEKALGRGIFEFLADHPDQAQAFHEVMADLAARMAVAVAEAYDFTPIRTLVDVGGGRGALISEVLARHPHMHGTVFDLEPALAEAPPTLTQAGVRDRCKLVAGNFFEGVPPGADAYVLSHVLHDWDDERARRILQGVRAAAHGESRVLIVETVLPEADVPLLLALLDLQVMVVLGGRERTEREFGALLESAGFDLVQVVYVGWLRDAPVDLRLAVIEGRPRQL